MTLKINSLRAVLSCFTTGLWSWNLVPYRLMSWNLFRISLKNHSNYDYIVRLLVRLMSPLIVEHCMMPAIISKTKLL